MQDPVYRSGVAAEQTAYNQPPHVGMYMGSEVFAPEVESIEVASQPTKTIYAQGEELDTAGLVIKATYIDGTWENVTAFITSGYDPEVVGEQTVTVSYLGKTTTFNVEVKAIEKIEIETPPTKTVYTPGQSISTAGLKVKAYFEGGIEKYLADTDYTLSGHKPFVAGEQTITVTYKEKTAEFTISVKTITGVEVVPPSKTTYYQGQALDTSDMIVYAIYNDGSKAPTTDYIYSGYNSKTLGQQTITISLSGKTTTFTVTVKPATIASMNNTYSTTSTETVTKQVPIGSYDGTFILEHTVKINSMPANGDQDKNSTAGFLVKFMPEDSTTNTGVGAGWYMTANGTDKANILWKADGRRATSITTSAITIGKEYTFRYTFTNVGTGAGATVAMEVFDENGTSMGSATNLSLRNMTSSDMHKTLPMTYLSIFNQANSGSTASVTFDNARVYNTSEIVSVSGKDITLNITSTTTSKLYAAKYDNGTLTNVEEITLSETGNGKVVSATFEPDKVFLWSEIYPIDMWSKTE